MTKKKSNRTKTSSPTDKQIHVLTQVGDDFRGINTLGDAGERIREYEDYGMPKWQYTEIMKEANEQSELSKIRDQFKRKQSEASGFSDYDAEMEDIVNELNRRLRGHE